MPAVGPFFIEYGFCGVGILLALLATIPRGSVGFESRLVAMGVAGGGWAG